MRFIVVVLSFSIFLAIFGGSVSADAPACPLKPKTYWATDGNFCYPMRNKCYFDSENEARKSRSQRPLTGVWQIICQGYCNKNCENTVDPICAEYGGKYAQFTNECEMVNYACKTGETYIKSTLDKCSVVPFDIRLLNQ